MSVIESTHRKGQGGGVQMRAFGFLLYGLKADFQEPNQGNRS
jgi:hypothetical protein